MVYVRQKECDERAAAAMISAVYRVPHSSLCVHRTLMLFLKVRCLVKCRNSRITALSRENAERFAKLQRVGKNRGAFDKKCRNTLPAQIQRQTIKVQCLNTWCRSTMTDEWLDQLAVGYVNQE